MWWRTFKAYAFDSYGVVVSDKEAESFRKTFFRQFPELEYWHKQAKNEARMYSQVVTPLGRIRYLPNIESTDKELQGRAERQAINTPVQSTASDMLVLAMHMADDCIEADYGARIVGEVHDALLIDCPEEHAVKCGLYVKYVMEEIVTQELARLFGVVLDVPIIADITIGKGWGIGKAL
jgi:DNA polymerase-1